MQRWNSLLRRISLLGALGAAAIAIPAFAGPPAESKAEAEPKAEPEAEPEVPSSPETGRDAPGRRELDVSAVGESQRRLESGMQSIGEMVADAKEDADAVRSACIVDKQQRGQDVMEVATGELLVVRDPSATGEQKQFAAEKLQAAADRLDTLVAAARACAGDQAPEAEDDVTRNEQDAVQTIPLADPTHGGASSPIPPAVDDSRPVTVASPEL